MIQKFLFIAIVITLSACNSHNSKTQQFDAKNDTTVVDTLTVQLPIESVPVIDSSLIVIDTNTNLMWMKHDFSFIENRFMEDWNEAQIFCDSLNTINYAGFKDWRIPTTKEYRTINKDQNDRKIYRELFIEIDSNNYWGNGANAFWSSTQPSKYVASYISFNKGWAISGSKEKQLVDGKRIEKKGMSVRLVRGKEKHNTEITTTQIENVHSIILSNAKYIITHLGVNQNYHLFDIRNLDYDFIGIGISKDSLNIIILQNEEVQTKFNNFLEGTVDYNSPVITIMGRNSGLLYYRMYCSIKEMKLEVDSTEMFELGVE